MALRKDDCLRIGVDLGGTKIEFVTLERDGTELYRHRIPTPRFEYDGTVRAIADGVKEMEKQLGRTATVGVGIPGTVSTRTRLVKNANSTWRPCLGSPQDRKSTRLNSSHRCISYAVFCLK